MKLQLKRDIIPGDEHMRVYHSHARLTERTSIGFAGGLPNQIFGTLTEQPAAPVVDALLAILGVETAEVHPYFVAVRKAAAHTWEEIERSVLLLLASFNLGEGRLLEPEGHNATQAP